ncbi:LysR family transcriptional regulator [Novosphingobium guangzhouense]|uniref:LysR family transcriptional regulator n=1 Tax=Novosphingobium guangzhouense TaxID=1850347 RepID=UPI0026947911
MRRDEMADMTAFLMVAEERSFTRAAVRLGMSQSSLSQIIRKLEARLGLRLLSRTTRSVAPTEAGDRLIATLAPMMRDMDAAIASLSDLRDKPSGTIRITTVEHAAKVVLLPAMERLLPSHPDIMIEITVDYGMTDIVADRFDAGVRLGGEIAKDMIAVRISADVPMAIVGAPSYFEARGRPNSPSELVEHRAINLRLPSSGTLNGWRLTVGNAKHACASMVRLFSTRSISFAMPLWPDMGSPTFRSIRSRTILVMVGLNVCCPVPRPIFPAITFTTRAVGLPRQPSSCSWTHCDTVTGSANGAAAMGEALTAERMSVCCTPRDYDVSLPKGPLCRAGPPGS